MQKLAYVLVMVIALSGAAGGAFADVPTGPPTFSDPLTIDNPYFPFEPNGIKVFRGKDEGKPAAAVDSYFTETRTFNLGGTDVETRILEEINFKDGELEERTRNYFAQADDGTVYYFGEVVDNYENGVIVNHNGSWLVGGPTAPSDPPETATATVPAVFMPANPELGDTFKPEDLFPIVDETAEIVAIRKKMKIAGKTYENVLQVLETTQIDDSQGYKWYAPGVGVVQARSTGEILRLIASTID